MVTALKPPVLAIVGPTAVGKSALAMKLAPKLDAEIVCIDSATVYRGMDTGTDKPTAEDRAAVSHHLLDLLGPDETLTVAEFQRRGREAVEQIRGNGRTPLLVGGSGLYFRAMVDPLEFPGTDPAVRARLEAELEEKGPEALYRRLEHSDPEAAGRIHPANTRRTVRALEVLELTGRPFSSYRTGWDPRESIYDLKVAGLRLPVEQMDGLIDARVDKLLAQGWAEEVARLPELSVTAEQVLGYAQILQFQGGSITLEEAVAKIKQRTRKFARRQISWFKADPRIVWFEDAARAEEYLIG